MRVLASTRIIPALLAGSALVLSVQSVAAPVGGVAMPMPIAQLLWLQSDEASDPTEGRRVKRTPTMREQVYRQLSEAQQAAEAENIAEAKRLVIDLRDDTDLTSYERAQVFNFLAYIHYNESDYPRAIAAYEEVLAQEDLPEAMRTQTLYSVAQLHFVDENYTQAERYLRRWMEIVPNPKSDAYMLLGQAIYAQERYQAALEPIRTGIQMARDAGEPVKEQWLQLLLAIHHELDNPQRMAEILEELILKFPKKSYWIQLSGIYGTLDQPEKRLIVLELAHKQGMLEREQEYLNLAQLSMQQDMPYQGAKILEEGMERGIVPRDVDNMRLLAQAYMMAQEEERAIPPLKLAAEGSDDGDLYLRLANAYMNQNEYAASEQAAEQALAKRTDRGGDAWFLIGMARFNQEKLDGAAEAFRRASRDDDNARAASQWLTYIEKEKERRDQLAAAIGG